MSAVPGSKMQQLTAAVEKACFGDFDRLAQGIWAAYGAGLLSDDEASTLAASLQARRTSNRPVPRIGASLPKRMFKRAPTQRSPDRARSIGRRRLLAASGPLPPQLAANFTQGELAVLKIVGDECVTRGCCDLDLAQIAARAGVCITTARNAIRFAELDCLVTVLRRPRPGLRHLPNVIRVVRAEWKLWLQRRRLSRLPDGNAAPLIPTGIGCKKTESTVSDLLNLGFKDRLGVWRPKGIGDRTALVAPNVDSKK
jgi:hypothetical protein